MAALQCRKCGRELTETPCRHCWDELEALPFHELLRRSANRWKERHIARVATEGFRPIHYVLWAVGFSPWVVAGWYFVPSEYQWWLWIGVAVWLVIVHQLNLKWYRWMHARAERRRAGGAATS